MTSGRERSGGEVVGPEASGSKAVPLVSENERETSCWLVGVDFIDNW